jgi:hypothetical protein
MAEHVGHERLKAAGRPVTGGAFSSSSSSSSSISRFEGTDGRGCGKARPWLWILPIRCQLAPPFDPLRVPSKPLAPLVQARKNETGHSNPIARHPAPAAPFNNILSPMRQDYACLQSATVIHFAARGIKRYSLARRKGGEDVY